VEEAEAVLVDAYRDENRLSPWADEEGSEERGRMHREKERHIAISVERPLIKGVRPIWVSSRLIRSVVGNT